MFIWDWLQLSRTFSLSLSLKFTFCLTELRLWVTRESNSMTASMQGVKYECQHLFFHAAFTWAFLYLKINQSIKINKNGKQAQRLVQEQTQQL